MKTIKRRRKNQEKGEKKVLRGPLLEKPLKTHLSRKDIKKKRSVSQEEASKKQREAHGICKQENRLDRRKNPEGKIRHEPFRGTK